MSVKSFHYIRTFWIFNFYGFIRIYYGYIDYFVIRNKDLYGFIAGHCRLLANTDLYGFNTDILITFLSVIRI